ncbi:MAG: hypothetical protein ACOYL8_01480 [Patescibacteria group bacterium]
MNRKSFFSASLILLALFIALPFSAFSQNIKEAKVSDGIYMGKYYNTPMFYEVTKNEIKPLGLCFPYFGIKIEDETAFYLLLDQRYFKKFLYCEKLAIEKSDYGKGEINTNKEFIGFHSGPLLGDQQYQDGILFAIKDTLDGKMLITILDLTNYNFYQTIGVVTPDKSQGLHRKLNFVVNGEINNFKDENWEITLNPITNYVWRGIFNVYINGGLRFEIEVIDN